MNPRKEKHLDPTKDDDSDPTKETKIEIQRKTRIQKTKIRNTKILAFVDLFTCQEFKKVFGYCSIFSHISDHTVITKIIRSRFANHPLSFMSPVPVHMLSSFHVLARKTGFFIKANSSLVIVRQRGATAKR